MTLTSLINSSKPPSIVSILFPIDYQSITSLVMDPDFNNKTPYRIHGKTFPNIDYWAARTRIDYPPKGKYEIDKTEAIYYYESTPIN